MPVSLCQRFRVICSSAAAPARENRPRRRISAIIAETSFFMFQTLLFLFVLLVIVCVIDYFLRSIARIVKIVKHFYKKLCEILHATKYTPNSECFIKMKDMQDWVKRH